MSIREIFTRVADEEAWTEDSQFDVLLRYIENQASDDAFQDYLVEQRVSPPTSMERPDPADDFLSEVADLLQHQGLAHDADFQEFCANIFDTVTTEQAAERWRMAQVDREERGRGMGSATVRFAVGDPLCLMMSPSASARRSTLPR